MCAQSLPPARRAPERHSRISSQRRTSFCRRSKDSTARHPNDEVFIAEPQRGKPMVRRVALSKGAIVALAAAGYLAAGLLSTPAAHVGWAAEPKTFIWGKSGDADTLDINVTSNGEA